jgi:hypothetical protein
LTVAGETIFRVTVGAADSTALLAALSAHNVHPTGTPRPGPATSGPAAISVEAYVTQAEIDALGTSGVTVTVIEDASANGLARQQEVGQGDRFAGNILPQGLGQLIPSDDVVL